MPLSREHFVRAILLRVDRRALVAIVLWDQGDPSEALSHESRRDFQLLKGARLHAKVAWPFTFKPWTS